MRRKKFGVDNHQSGRRERTRCREQRVVLEVFVIDRVELAKVHQVECVVDLDAQPTVVGQQPAQRPGEAQEIGNVRVDVVRDYKVRGAVRGAHPGRQFLVKEGRYGWHATRTCGRYDIHRRFDAEAWNTSGNHMLEQVTVIAGDFDHKRFGTE